MRNFKEIYTDLNEQRVYSYSSIQVNLSGRNEERVFDFISTIPEDDIYTLIGLDKYGFESKPHVTVRYGTDETDYTKIKPALYFLQTIKATMKKVSIFECEKYDVLKVEIESSQLHELNKKLGNYISFPGETFPDYNPHMTIAYMRKGKSKKFIGSDFFNGTELIFNSVIFSSISGIEHELKL